MVNTDTFPSLGFSFNSVLETCFIGHLIQSLSIMVNEMSANCLKKIGHTVSDIPTIADIPQGISEAAISCFKNCLIPMMFDVLVMMKVESLVK